MVNIKNELIEVSIKVTDPGVPILYSTLVNGSTSQDEFVMNFCQNSIAPNEARIIARIAMSRKFAKQFLADMGKLLAMTEGQLQVGQKSKN